MKTRRLTIATLVLLPGICAGQQQSNPLYSASNSSGDNPLYTEQSVNNSDTNTDSAIGQQPQVLQEQAAQSDSDTDANWNSTRSNQLQSRTDDSDRSSNSKRGVANRNTTRSNRTQPLQAQGDVAGTVAPPADANHNTTRSNRLAPGSNNSGASGQGSAGSSRAQDYNSSRSNNSSAIEALDDDDDGDSLSDVEVEKFNIREEFGQVQQNREQN